MKTITIYTDGACSGNPGPGGWGAILEWQGHEKELSGGEAQTTNNRMELTAVLTALALLKEPCIVELSGVEWDTPDGPVLHVRGADLVDGTPILDIKPYLPYCDAKPDATGGFTDGLSAKALTVDCPPALLERLPETDRPGLLAVLANDPRPRYQNDPQRLYGLTYAGHNVTFRVEGDKVTVVGVE